MWLLNKSAAASLGRLGLAELRKAQGSSVHATRLLTAFCCRPCPWLRSPGYSPRRTRYASKAAGTPALPLGRRPCRCRGDVHGVPIEHLRRRVELGLAVAQAPVGLGTRIIVVPPRPMVSIEFVQEVGIERWQETLIGGSFSIENPYVGISVSSCAQEETRGPWSSDVGDGSSEFLIEDSRLPSPGQHFCGAGKRSLGIPQVNP